jgi:ATP-binding cassette subfamily F protein uup
MSGEDHSLVVVVTGLSGAELQFNDAALTQEQINTLSITLQKLMDDIAIKEARWFELSEKLES